MISFQGSWGWPVALYLFLGGLAAGSFVAASLILLSRRRRLWPAVTTLYWLATACLVGGLLALLLELGRPERGIVLWMSFTNGTSLMACGAWGLAAALPVFLASALLSTMETARASAECLNGDAAEAGIALRALATAGSVVSLFLALYTGFLLRGATGVPFWDSPLLPAVFATSALTAGSNAAVLASCATGCARHLPRRLKRRAVLATMALTVLEATLLSAYLASMLHGGSAESPAQYAACVVSAESLVSGVYAARFWGLVVATGLAAPLALSGAGCAAGGRAGKIMLSAGSACALIGECALRFLVLHAGAQADFVATALLGLAL